MKKPEEYLSENQIDDCIVFIRKGVAIWLSDFIKEIQLDTMKDVELHMCILSDMTTKTQGYINLVEKIKELDI